MHVFLLPLAACIITFLWYVLWLSSAIFIFSVGTPEPREGFEFITEMKWDENTRYILIYHVFMLLWVNAFIIGAIQFIIGASACIWYFTCKTDRQGKDTILEAMGWLFKYHWGSVAIGSMIIAICQMIRLAFEYYRQKAGKLAEMNTFFKVIVVTTSYLLWLLENCIKYISKNAYI